MSFDYYYHFKQHKKIFDLYFHLKATLPENKTFPRTEYFSSSNAFFLFKLKIFLSKFFINFIYAFGHK